MGTSCKNIHIRKKIRKKIREKIQEDTFNDPVSTPYGKANSSLRPDSFLKSLVILKIFALAALVQKFVRMTSDFKKLFTGPGKKYIIQCKIITQYRFLIALGIYNVFLLPWFE